MAEIIKFPPEGGKDPKKFDQPDAQENEQVAPWRTPLAKEAQITSPGPRTTEQHKADTEWLQDSANAEKLSQYNETVTRAMEFIQNRVIYSAEEDNIRSWRVALMDKSIEHIIGVMIGSTEVQWQGHPAYFVAMRIEINHRMEIAAENRPLPGG